MHAGSCFQDQAMATNTYSDDASPGSIGSRTGTRTVSRVFASCRQNRCRNPENQHQLTKHLPSVEDLICPTFFIYLAIVMHFLLKKNNTVDLYKTVSTLNIHTGYTYIREV